MSRPKGSTNKVRLGKLEQVVDRKETTTEKTATGFVLKTTYTPYNELSVTEIRDLLIKCIWIENCVNTIVDEVIKYPLISNPKDEEIDSFLKYPSIKEPMMMVRKKTLKDMLRYGNGGVAIGYKNGKPYKLSVIPGYTIRVTGKEPPSYKFVKLSNTSFSSSSTAYKQKRVKSKDGKFKMVDIELPIKEFMHFQIDADSDRTQARSPIERAYNFILTDKQMEENLAKFTKKGFQKPFFAGLPDANKADVDQFLEWTNEILEEGAKTFGLNQPADIKNLPCWEAKDIIEMFRWIGLSIANIYKIPPFMLNLISDVGSLNAREQKARFLENVILPILEYEAYIYSLILVRLGFKKKVDVTSPVIGTKLTYDRARVARLLVGAEKGIFTVDEIRKDFFNKDPLTDEQIKKMVKTDKKEEEL